MMKPNIRFLQKVADRQVFKAGSYSMRRGGYTYVRGGEQTWKAHAREGYVTHPTGASMGRPCYAELTPKGEEALAATRSGEKERG